MTWNWKFNCIVTCYCDVSIVPIYAYNVMSLILKIKSANNELDMALKPIYLCCYSCGFRFVNISQNSTFDFYSNRMLIAHIGHYYLIYFFLNFSIGAKGQVRKLLMPIFVKLLLHYWNMCMVYSTSNKLFLWVISFLPLWYTTFAVQHIYTFLLLLLKSIVNWFTYSIFLSRFYQIRLNLDRALK